MSVQLINNSTTLSQVNSTTQQPKPQDATSLKEEIKLSEDKKEVKGIKKGLIPIAKGLLAGGSVGALAGAGLASVLSANIIGVFGDMPVGAAAGAGGIVGGIAGGIAGAVTANFTQNKAIAAGVGAVAGGTITFFTGTGWAIGVLAGGAGGVTGAALAQKK